MKIHDEKIRDSLELFEERAVWEYGSVRQFILQNGHLETGFKAKLRDNLEKINRWLRPLNLKIQIIKDGEDN